MDFGEKIELKVYTHQDKSDYHIHTPSMNSFVYFRHELLISFTMTFYIMLEIICRKICFYVALARTSLRFML